MEILLALIAVVIPAVATYVALQVMKALPAIDKLPGLVKQLVAIVFAWVAAKLSAIFGVPFPAQLAGLADPTVVAGILAGVTSWLVHKLFHQPLLKS